MVSLEIGNNGPFQNGRWPLDVSEKFELAMFAHLGLHESHFVTHLEEMVSTDFERHLQRFSVVALHPRSKVVDELARVEIKQTLGGLTVELCRLGSLPALGFPPIAPQRCDIP